MIMDVKLQIVQEEIIPSETVCNLGVIFYCQMSMSSQVASLSRSVTYHVSDVSWTFTPVTMSFVHLIYLDWTMAIFYPRKQMTLILHAFSTFKTGRLSSFSSQARKIMLLLSQTTLFQCTSALESFANFSVYFHIHTCVYKRAENSPVCSSVIFSPCLLIIFVVLFLFFVYSHLIVALRAMIILKRCSIIAFCVYLFMLVCIIVWKSIKTMSFVQNLLSHPQTHHHFYPHPPIHTLSDPTHLQNRPRQTHTHHYHHFTTEENKQNLFPEQVFKVTILSYN